MCFSSHNRNYEALLAWFSGNSSTNWEKKPLELIQKDNISVGWLTRFYIVSENKEGQNIIQINRKKSSDKHSICKIKCFSSLCLLAGLKLNMQFLFELQKCSCCLSVVFVYENKEANAQMHLTFAFAHPSKIISCQSLLFVLSFFWKRRITFAPSSKPFSQSLKLFVVQYKFTANCTASKFFPVLLSYSLSDAHAKRKKKEKQFD